MVGSCWDTCWFWNIFGSSKEDAHEITFLSGEHLKSSLLILLRSCLKMDWKCHNYFLLLWIKSSVMEFCITEFAIRRWNLDLHRFGRNLQKGGSKCASNKGSVVILYRVVHTQIICGPDNSFHWFHKCRGHIFWKSDNLMTDRWIKRHKCHLCHFMLWLSSIVAKESST